MDKKWKINSSSYLIRSPWFTVRADNCTTSQNIDISPYYVVESYDFVHVLATIDDKVILVRQYRHGIGDYSLELPGGIMGADESDPVSVAVRELREETGYHGGTWSYILPLTIDSARYNNRLHFVRAKGVFGGEADPDPTENIETVLITRNEVILLAKNGGIVNASHAAMLLIGLL